VKRLAASLALAFVLVGSVGSTASANSYIQGATSGVWVNSDSFTKSCLLGVTDNFPSYMYSQANTLLRTMGFTNPSQPQIGHGFTRSAFLGSLYPDYAEYVHSHGDVYSYPYGSAFWQDPASGCGSNLGDGSSGHPGDLVTANQIKANAHPPYNVVIMSTCYLGSMTEHWSGLTNTMPDAFGISKTKVYSGARFYMGYVNDTYDSASYYFENNMLYYLELFPGSTFSSAWTYANGLYYGAGPDSSDPFSANWFGDWTLY
jgi:hypothetical protein